MNELIKAIKEISVFNSCKRKIRYGHEETARQARSKMAAKGHQGLEIYHCKHCNGFHLGHPKGNVRFRFSVITKANNPISRIQEGQ